MWTSYYVRNGLYALFQQGHSVGAPTITTSRGNDNTKVNLLPSIFKIE